MGHTCKDGSRIEFDSPSKMEFHGDPITSDAALVAHRDLDKTLELAATGKVFCDSRRAKTTQLA